MVRAINCYWTTESITENSTHKIYLKWPKAFYGFYTHLLHEIEQNPDFPGFLGYNDIDKQESLIDREF